MGFFSWNTMDTKESISNIYSVRGALPVKVLIPKEFTEELGSYIEEKAYEGYGVFGGKDIYELIAKWNCPEAADCKDEDKFRNLGIDIACWDDDHKNLKYPIRIVSIDYQGTYEDLTGFAHSDEEQGFFYS